MSLSPKKLLHSKWTRLQPEKRERHFLVVEVEYDEDQRVTRCVIEAVLTRKQYPLDWRELNDSTRWTPGWQ